MTLPRPRFQLGYVSPLPVVDALHYEFYQAIPQDVVLIAAPVPLSDFTGEAVNDIFATVGEVFRYLARRRADRIVFGGMPPSALAGRQRMIDLMVAAERETGVPVTSDIEDVIACLARLGIRKIAIAAKWKPPVMQAVEAYFRDAGMNVLGACGADYGTHEIANIVTTESMGLAYQLGDSALRAHPAAEALVLGGGTWLSIPTSARLEQEFGTPVVSNMTAMFLEAGRAFQIPVDALAHLRLAQPDAATSAAASA